MRGYKLVPEYCSVNPNTGCAVKPVLSTSELVTSHIALVKARHMAELREIDGQAHSALAKDATG